MILPMGARKSMIDGDAKSIHVDQYAINNDDLDGFDDLLDFDKLLENTDSQEWFPQEMNVIGSGSRDLIIIDHDMPEEMSVIQEDMNSPVESMMQVTNIPIGYRFKPKDTELIYCLRKMVNNEPLPTDKIHVVNLYDFNAPDLVDYFGDNDGGVRYFITPLKAKNKGTKYKDRRTPNGFWKANSGEHTIKHGGIEVGSHKTLVYYEGKRSKTDWIMHEYRLKDDPMVENTWVVCKIYNGKKGKSNKRLNV